jgi:hypothetical protein
MVLVVPRSSCLVRTPGGKPPSPGTPAGHRSRASSMSASQWVHGRSERSVPTQNVVQGFIGINNSSSSSHVWKLGIGPLSPAQAPDAPVGQLWVVSVLPVSTRGHLDGCAPVTRPVHPLSPASPRSVPRSCARRDRGSSAATDLCRPIRRARRHFRRSEPCDRVPRATAPEGAAGRAPRVPMTPGEPADTRSPQPVHIPGDNFSTSRCRSPCRYPQLRLLTGDADAVPASHSCGQGLRRPPDDTAARCRAMPRGVSVVPARRTDPVPLTPRKLGASLRTPATTGGRGS